MNSKTNQKLLFLRAIGIFLVVYGHVGGRHVAGIFPINSFHMPLFIFASGYFYRLPQSGSWLSLVGKKIRRLVLPYYFWNAFYAAVLWSLRRLGLVWFGDPINLYSFFAEPWLTGHQYVFNLAAWFMLTLFLIQVFYDLLRRCLPPIGEAWLLALCLLVTFLALYGSALPGPRPALAIVFLKAGFGMFFYHLGYLYRRYLEPYDVLSVRRLLAAFALQSLLLGLGGDIGYFMSFADFHGHLLTPLLASVTGIWICLQGAEILRRALSKSFLLGALGQHSGTVMMHHLFCYWLLKAALGQAGALGFDKNAFGQDIFYAYAPLSAGGRLLEGGPLLTAVLCCAFPLLAKRAWEKARSPLLRRLSPKKSG